MTSRNTNPETYRPQSSETSFSENPVSNETAISVDGDRGNLVDDSEPARHPDTRVVFINQPQTDKFVGNRITTAKYNKYNFIPSFLFEQFRRYSNCFFLLIACLQQIPDVSPTGRFTTLVPLIFILFVSALKEIVEDYKRHKADDETNRRIVEVLQDGKWEKILWQNLEVGNIVKLSNNAFFPADILVLSSSEPQGMCYIETMNLDGETNLKIRQALPETSKYLDSQMLSELQGTIECEKPNKMIYEFVGNLKLTGLPTIPLGPERMLLRGAMLRNTSWVFGVTVYTGSQTKLMVNSSRAPLKRSTVDKITNTQVVMLFFLLIFLCVVSSLYNELWTRQNQSAYWYLGIDANVGKNFAFNLLTFVILFNNLIPISLQVTLEIVRFVQAIFINMDLDMYHEETDTPAMARTSNLNEELGMVKYIFSDKTGTLTRNIMEFKKCSVAGTVFDAAPVGSDPLTHPLIKTLLERLPHQSFEEAERNMTRAQSTAREFLILMSICHTVIPEKTALGEVLYHASSPDESALLQAARNYGFAFDTRLPNSVEIVALGRRETYEILNVIEFTSSRKRMSIITRTPSGKIVLYCKGADSVIYERLAKNGQQYTAETLKHLEEFASDGLRTLCFAMAELRPQEYEQWNKEYYKASIAVKNRELRLEEVGTMIEKNLILLGASAVEDRLQDKVPETIAALIKAGINVWVLTGDKQETAINIGYSSKLLQPGQPLLIINETSLEMVRESILHHMNAVDPQGHFALIIDGLSLKFALMHELKPDFLQLCIACKSVVCCRVSPMQKAEVVGMVTSNTKGVTLAIGDGANDVAMIQKAHVGIGISGQEGLQAACASDYSIAQFRFLLKLLFVHGSWNYNRMIKIILYSFYKNICLYVMELWFAIYSGWSGQILFERWTIGMYNVIFTAFPPLAIGLFDKVCSADVMLRYPKLYSHRPSFGVLTFWIWIGNALVHSIILYWLPMLALQHDTVWVNGREGGYLVLGNFVYTYVVVVVCLKAGLHMNFWTIITHLAIWGSILLWFLFVIAYSHVWPVMPIGAVMSGMDIMLFSSLPFWLGLFVIPIATLIPDLSVIVIQRTLFKTLKEAVREQEINKKDPKNLLQEGKQSAPRGMLQERIDAKPYVYRNRLIKQDPRMASNTDLKSASEKALKMEKVKLASTTVPYETYKPTENEILRDKSDSSQDKTLQANKSAFISPARVVPVISKEDIEAIKAELIGRGLQPKDDPKPAIVPATNKAPSPAYVPLSHARSKVLTSAHAIPSNSIDGPAHLPTTDQSKSRLSTPSNVPSILNDQYKDVSKIDRQSPAYIPPPTLPAHLSTSTDQSKSRLSTSNHVPLIIKDHDFSKIDRQSSGYIPPPTSPARLPISTDQPNQSKSRLSPPNHVNKHVSVVNRQSPAYVRPPTSKGQSPAYVAPFQDQTTKSGRESPSHVIPSAKQSKSGAISPPFVAPSAKQSKSRVISPPHVASKQSKSEINSPSHVAPSAKQSKSGVISPPHAASKPSKSGINSPSHVAPSAKQSKSGVISPPHVASKPSKSGINSPSHVAPSSKQSESGIISPPNSVPLTSKIHNENDDSKSSQDKPK